MLFTPQNYTCSEDLLNAYIVGDAHSDTCFMGIDVFGYLNGEPYSCAEEYDEISGELYIVAGSPIHKY